MNAPRLSLAGLVAILVLLALAPTASADPTPPETGIGDHVTYYSVRSATATMKQSWMRTFPDRPCDELTCDCEGAACASGPTLCVARPELCVTYGSQVYKFGLTLAGRRDSRAYLVKRHGSHKLAGAILLKVNPANYGEAHGPGDYPCTDSKIVSQPSQPNYLDLSKAGSKIRIVERTTVFSSDTACVRAPNHHDMVTAGFVPTFLTSRSKFKRSHFTLKLKSEQPFSLGGFAGTISSHITIRLKKTFSGVQRFSSHVPTG
jgi:hypothetical protein